MDLTPESIKWILISLIVLVASVAFHEFGHAFAAHRLGDDTPKRQGRVTLNPLAHADPIGTILLPVVGGIYAASGGGVGGFGWGKPVMWQPHRIRRGIKMATANIIVSFAGPFMNVVLALLITAIHAILTTQGIGTHGEGYIIFKFAVMTNFVLFFFNLLPLPPLDGGHIAQALMPYRHREAFDNIAKFGPIVILALMLIPQIRQVFIVPATWCTSHLYGIFGL